MADEFNCPYCGNENLLNGPCGGGTETFICANKNCRHVFYVGASCSLEDAHSIWEDKDVIKLPDKPDHTDREILEKIQTSLEGLSKRLEDIDKKIKNLSDEIRFPDCYIY